MSWRFFDHPMTGSIYRLPDDRMLQRGITYTILPDDRMMQVPSMNRMEVRAASQGHQENEDHDVMDALQQLLGGKKPVKGRARFNRRGQAHGARVQAHRGGIRGAPDPLQAVVGEGLRPVGVEGRGGARVAEA